MYYPGIALIVVSNILYHVSQKSTPAGVNPAVSLLIAYSFSVILTAALLLFFPLKESLGESIARLNLWSIALGAAVVGVELGFLLAYRFGSNIGVTQFTSTVILTFILLPIGLLFYHEKLSVINVSGIIICILGFLMMHYRK